MRQAGVRPGIDTLVLLMQIHMSLNRPQQALAVFDDMRRGGVPQTTLTLLMQLRLALWMRTCRRPCCIAVCLVLIASC